MADGPIYISVKMITKKAGSSGFIMLGLKESRCRNCRERGERVRVRGKEEEIASRSRQCWGRSSTLKRGIGSLNQLMSAQYGKESPMSRLSHRPATRPAPSSAAKQRIR
jgi:hypothetical protein